MKIFHMLYFLGFAALMLTVLFYAEGSPAQQYASGIVALAPASSATPAPPTLTNAQVITPGVTLNGCTIFGDGVHDDGACLNTAASHGDLDFKVPTSGVAKYFINWTGGVNPAVGMPAGRNVLCENPSLPPTPANAKIIITETQDADLVIFDYNGVNGGTVYGCEFQGGHYPNTTWSPDTVANSPPAVSFFTGASNHGVYNNDFEGWPGNTAPVVGVQNFGQSAPTNDNISYNTFFNCETRGVEFDGGQNIQITHNFFQDCSIETEIQDYRVTGVTQLYDSNTIKWVTGGNGGNFASNYPNHPFVTAGVTCHSAGGGFPCTTGEVADYSGNTFSNNIIQTAPMTNWVWESDSSNPIQKPVYCGNTCTGNCVFTNGPGNASTNGWSSQGFCPSGSTQ